MRRRRSSSASSGMSTRKGRIAVAPATCSVGTDMWVSLVGVVLVVDGELAVLDGAGAFLAGQVGGSCTHEDPCSQDLTGVRGRKPEVAADRPGGPLRWS